MFNVRQIQTMFKEATKQPYDCLLRNIWATILANNLQKMPLQQQNKTQHTFYFLINEGQLTWKAKISTMCRTVKKLLPSPEVSKSCQSHVLGKCSLSKPTHLKLKKHCHILRLPTMKGKSKSKKTFVTCHKKQIGGFIPLFVLLIAGALESVGPKLLGTLPQQIKSVLKTDIV